MACVVWVDEFKRNLSFNYLATFENVCVSLSFKQKELKLFRQRSLTDLRRYDTTWLQVHSVAGSASLNSLVKKPLPKIVFEAA